MIKREDLSIHIKCGTMRTTESLLKLNSHGLIQKQSTPTFDQLERIEAFLDSPQHKQYETRLKRIITKPVKERLELISRIICVKDKRDMLELTDLGESTLKEKRRYAITQYEKMEKLYKEDKGKFFATIHDDTEGLMLPLLVAMGISNSIMMHTMISNYGFSDYGFSDIGNIEYGELDLGFDFGG